MLPRPPPPPLPDLRRASRVHLSHFPMFFGIRNLRLASPASGFTGQGRWPRALRSRGLCRLDVRNKATAGPRSAGSPSPRMRRVGRAAQRDDDTARRARPCACIRRYNENPADHHGARGIYPESSHGDLLSLPLRTKKPRKPPGRKFPALLGFLARKTIQTHAIKNRRFFFALKTRKSR